MPVLDSFIHLCRSLCILEDDWQILCCVWSDISFISCRNYKWNSDSESLTGPGSARHCSDSKVSKMSIRLDQRRSDCTAAPKLCSLLSFSTLFSFSKVTFCAKQRVLRSHADSLIRNWQAVFLICSRIIIKL